MKITIENFGPIHKFEIDLSKNISLIYGKNNIGKSYAISVVYMLLKSFPQMTKGSDLKSAIQKYNSNIKNLRTDIIPGSIKSDREELLSRVNSVLEYLLNDWIPEKFKLYLKSSYGDLKNVKNSMSDSPGQIIVEMNFLRFRFALLENLDVGGKIGVSYIKKEYFASKKYSRVNIESICYTILKDFFRNISLYTTSFYYIPAVRSGYYLGLGNLGSIISEINQYQGMIGQPSFTLPNTTVPVSDFYSQISNKSAFNFADEYNYMGVVQKIEKNILDGTVQIDTQTGRILYFSNKLKRTFDLSQVSSMVSELSIITAYFKYIIRDHVSLDNFDGEKSLSVGVFPTLFVEEPESHLHPEAQVKLMEYFVGLANLGLKIIMTTHSDYMFNKLTNLLMQGEIKSNDVGSYLLESTETGSVSDAEKMAALQDGINDYNFIETTELLYNERIVAEEKHDSQDN